MKSILRARTKTILAAVALVLVAAAPHFYRSHPAVRCGLPKHDYQYGEYSRTVRSLSRVPFQLRPPLVSTEMILTNPEATYPQFRRRPPHAIKAFQFVEDPRLRIDHCSISQITVQLLEDGNWILSLRADQNPPPTELDARRKVTTQEEPILFTEHIQRNQFFVRAQCFAGFGTGDRVGLVGKPIVIPLEIDPFWVQNGRPRPMYITGFCQGVEEFFELIDRVEIEFHYRIN